MGASTAGFAFCDVTGAIATIATRGGFALVIDTRLAAFALTILGASAAGLAFCDVTGAIATVALGRRGATHANADAIGAYDLTGLAVGARGLGVAATTKAALAALGAKDTRATFATSFATGALFKTVRFAALFELETLEASLTSSGVTALFAHIFVARAGAVGLADRDATSCLAFVAFFAVGRGALGSTSTAAKLAQNRLITALAILALSIVLTETEGLVTAQVEALSTSRRTVTGAAARLHTNGLSLA